MSRFFRYYSEIILRESQFKISTSGFDFIEKIDILGKDHLVYHDETGRVWLAHCIDRNYLNYDALINADYRVWCLCFGPVSIDTPLDASNQTTIPYILAARPFAKNNTKFAA